MPPRLICNSMYQLSENFHFISFSLSFHTCAKHVLMLDKKKQLLRSEKLANPPPSKRKSMKELSNIVDTANYSTQTSCFF